MNTAWLAVLVFICGGLGLWLSSLILEALRRQATLNARLFAAHQAELLTGPVGALDEALEQVGLKQAERGAVLGLSQSAVSRRRKRGEEGEAQKDTNVDA